MHVFGLLCITRVYGKSECMPMKHAKCVTRACANQNVRVQFMQTKHAHAVFMQAMMHTVAY